MAPPLDLFFDDYERENIVLILTLGYKNKWFGGFSFRSGSGFCEVGLLRRGAVVAHLAFLYTVSNMQQFFNNRYTQLAVLTVVLSSLFFAVIWLVAQNIGLRDFPVTLEIMLSVLGAGFVVYKYLSRRIA